MLGSRESSLLVFELREEVAGEVSVALFQVGVRVSKLLDHPIIEVVVDECRTAEVADSHEELFKVKLATWSTCEGYLVCGDILYLVRGCLRVTTIWEMLHIPPYRHHSHR